MTRMHIEHQGSSTFVQQWRLSYHVVFGRWSNIQSPSLLISVKTTVKFKANSLPWITTFSISSFCLAVNILYAIHFFFKRNKFIKPHAWRPYAHFESTTEHSDWSSQPSSIKLGKWKKKHKPEEGSPSLGDSLPPLQLPHYKLPTLKFKPPKTYKTLAR